MSNQTYLKDEPMSNMKEEATDNPTLVTELPNDAYGIFKDGKTGEWKVAVIQYDGNTGECKLYKTIDTGGYREMAIDKFKIEVGRMLFGD